MSIDSIFPSLLFGINEDWLISLVGWFDITSICMVDVAVSNVDDRTIWLNILRSSEVIGLISHWHCPLSLEWLILRQIRVKSIRIRKYMYRVTNGNVFEDHKTKYLCRRKFTSIRDTDIVRIAKNYPMLCMISLYHGCCDELSDIGLTALARHCNQIHTINLHTSLATDKTLVALQKGCPLISNLTLHACHFISDTGLSYLAQRGTQLKTICLSQCDLISDNGIVALAQGSPLLENVDLSGHLYSRKHQITDISLIILGKHCPNIKRIKLDRRKAITKNGYEAIAIGCVSLNDIGLSHSRICNSGLEAIAKNSSQLTTIDLSWCKRFSDIGIYALADHCHKLKHTNLINCRISDSAVLRLAAGCPLLNSISLSACNVSDRGIIDLAQSHSLFPTTNPVGTCITNNLVNPVSFFPIIIKYSALINIDLRSCDTITDTSVVEIGVHCPLLSYINLERTRVTDRGIISLAEGCPLLTGVDFSYCDNVSDIGIVTLALKCPLLSCIRLILPDSLHLSDAFLLALGNNCHNLVNLIFPNSLITDSGLTALSKGCLLLENLSIFNCSKISINGLIILLQNCKMQSICISDRLKKDFDEHCGEDYPLMEILTQRIC